MSSGGGNQTTTSRTEPYAPAEPYLQDILGEAQNIYRSGLGRSFFPGSTVVPFADQTRQALELQQAAALEQMAPSAMLGQAANTFGQFAGGPMSAYAGRMNTGLGMSQPGMTTQGLGTSLPMGQATGLGSAYGQLSPQADYLSDVRSGITSDVLGDVQSQFGGMGRTGTSPQAQQAVARGVTQAYAPLAAQLGQTERGRELSSLESSLGRQFGAGQAGLGREQTALESQLGRLYGGGQSDLQRRQAAMESQFGRQFGASEADIARQQAGMESAFGRSLTAAGQLPGIQNAMDMRRRSAIGDLSGVGSAYEQLAQRQLQDQIARFQFGQQAPMRALQQYAGLISPIAGGFPTSVGTAPSQSASGAGGAFGGAVAGSALGTPGIVGGALLGGLGFL